MQLTKYKVIFNINKINMRKNRNFYNKRINLKNSGTINHRNTKSKRPKMNLMMVQKISGHQIIQIIYSIYQTVSLVD